jgi:autotransporter translocation and assembly factor TamB
VGRRLALRYPEGLRSLVDTDVRVFGDLDRPWVTGTIDVEQARWTRRYDVASELLAVGGTKPIEAGTDEGPRYDLKIRAPGTLRVDNNLAALQAGAELKLQGSSGAPVLLGRAQVERGRVYFQGRTYVIRRGTIDFTNPQRTEPLFDIEAETRVRSYRVTLRVNGTLTRVTPTLTSDPPLSALQILNLLAGGDESTVASLTQAQTDQARLAATGAASLAAGRISEGVGLERGAERLFGLNRFSIDPSVVKGGVTNPRLTVGKRITSDLSVLYTVDLRGTEERILTVEYTLSDRFSLLLTREDPGGFGVDVRLRQSH